MRSYVCTRDIHKRVMFANYIFANITSFAKFAKISSRENFQVHGIYIYIYICQDGGTVGFVYFTKLSFTLSSLAQSFDQMESISEYVFVIVIQRKAYAGHFQKEIAGKRTGPITKWPSRRLLFTRLEIVSAIISPL